MSKDVNYAYHYSESFKFSEKEKFQRKRTPENTFLIFKMSVSERKMKKT